jgi:hypothetical protein
MRNKVKLTIGGGIAALALAAPVAQAANAPPGCEKIQGTIVCSTDDSPHNNWTEDSTKKGSVNSSHEEESTATNPGGHQPPGAQP